MLDIQKIQSLYGLVGIRQPYNSDYAVFNAENLASESGLYLNDMPYFKAEYLIDSALGSDYTPEQINEDLINIKKSAIVDVCSRVFNKMDYIDNQVLYPKAQNKVNLETTIKNGFIGYRLTLSDLKRIAFKLNRLILEFSGTGSVKILLFNSSQSTALKEETVNITSNYQTLDLEWSIDNVDQYKGEYYLGFIYDATLTPYKRDYEYSDFQSSVKELSIEKVSVPNHNTETLFDLEEVKEITENVGINIDVTVYEDDTNFILKNKMLFARAIQMSTCINIYNRMVSSNRSNVNERHGGNLMDLIINFVNGSDGAGLKNKGLTILLGEEILTIQEEIQKLRKEVNGGSQIIVGTFR